MSLILCSGTDIHHWFLSLITGITSWLFLHSKSLAFYFFSITIYLYLWYRSVSYTHLDVYKRQERWRQKSKRIEQRTDTISIPFLMVTVISFFMMWLYALVSYILTGDKQDILTNRLWTVATYLSVYNKQTADVVSDIDSIIQSYLKNENIFETQKDTINRLREQIVTQTETLLKDCLLYTSRCV